MENEARPVKRSRFTGVVWCWKGQGRRKGKWKARIMIKGKTHHLGYFHDEVKAAEAYDRAVVELRQDGLKLNFPGGGHVRG